MLPKIKKEVKKTGYIILEFFDNDKEALKNYFNVLIDKKNYFYAKVSGKSKGGLVLDKMHTTLLYGLDDNEFDKRFLNKLEVEFVKLGKLELFYIEEFQCNALVLKINDKNKKLGKLHNILLELGVIKEKINKFKFTPHITIAYVKKDFKIEDENCFLDKKLKIKNIKYKIKN